MSISDSDQCRVDAVFAIESEQCDKSLATDLERFENMARTMSAFPFMPVEPTPISVEYGKARVDCMARFNNIKPFNGLPFGPVERDWFDQPFDWPGSDTESRSGPRRQP